MVLSQSCEKQLQSYFKVDISDSQLTRLGEPQKKEQRAKIIKKIQCDEMLRKCCVTGVLQQNLFTNEPQKLHI